MVEIRFISKDDIAEFVSADRYGFGHDDPTDGNTMFEQWLVDSDAVSQSIAAFDKGRIVGTFSSYPLQLTVPGGSSVGMAGTTWVTVQATHRRQGILTKMMGLHLHQAVEQGNVVAGLEASEETIYGRFGYGPACRALALTIPTGQLTVPSGPPHIELRTLTPDEESQLLPDLYSSTLGATPGAYARSEQWWQARHFTDRPNGRQGFGQRRVVAAFIDAEPMGYVVFRLASSWSEGLPTGRLQVVELGYRSDDVRRALWHHVCSVDLFPTVEATSATDDPILLEVDRRRPIKAAEFDTLWIRPLDIVAALSNRSYEADGSIVIEVADEFLKRGGRFALAVVDGRAECVPSSKPVDVVMTAATLGRIYLGGSSAIHLARSRHIDGDAKAVAKLDRLFRTSMAPHCPELF